MPTGPHGATSSARQGTRSASWLLVLHVLARSAAAGLESSRVRVMAGRAWLAGSCGELVNGILGWNAERNRTS